MNASDSHRIQFVSTSKCESRVIRRVEQVFPRWDMVRVKSRNAEHVVFGESMDLKVKMSFLRGWEAFKAAESSGYGYNDVIQLHPPRISSSLSFLFCSPSSSQLLPPPGDVRIGQSPFVGAFPTLLH